jgi:hypothetical protein
MNDVLEELETQIKNYWNKFFGKAPHLLFYHYTDFDALYKILRFRELWFTDYRNLNDPSEYIYGIDQYLSSLKKLKEPSQNFHYWSTIEKHIADLRQNPFTNKNGIKVEHPIYTFSFCGSKDYLPAWRLYGDNGSGVAIGFRPDYYSYTTKGSIINNPLANYNVIYSHEKIDKLILGLIKIIDNKFTKLDDSDKESLTISLISYFITYSIGFKHFGYEHENELRFVLWEQKINDQYCLPNGKNTPEITSDRKFILNGKNRVKSEHFLAEHIVEIWVGPAVENFNQRKKEIEDKLKEYGYDINKIEIIRSEMPYRHIK